MELCEPGIAGELRGLLLVVPVDKGLDRLDGSEYGGPAKQRRQFPCQPASGAPDRQEPAALFWRRQRLHKFQVAMLCRQVVLCAPPLVVR